MTRWGLRLLLTPLFLGREVGRQAKARVRSARLIRRLPYSGGPVAVIALYQQDRVRADLLGLMLGLRRKGVYVVAVNAGSLRDAGAQLPADVYVERPNLGRDFGSYKSGLQILKHMGLRPPRLMLFNDSVFYSAQGRDRFLDRLIHSPADICSATDSTEVRPHQTSFCLSFSQACAEHPSFVRFWQRYFPTDLRPLTVLLGEIALSQVLGKKGFSSETFASRDAIRARLEHHPDLAVPPPPAAVSETAIGAIEWCLAGNITHRAPGALLDLGVPLVKLDLRSRADLDDSILSAVLSKLPEPESETLGSIWEAAQHMPKSSSTLDRLGARCGLA